MDEVKIKIPPQRLAEAMVRHFSDEVRKMPKPESSTGKKKEEKVG